MESVSRELDIFNNKLPVMSSCGLAHISCSTTERLRKLSSNQQSIFSTKLRRLSFQLEKLTCLVQSMQAQQAGTLSQDKPTFLERTSRFDQILENAQSIPSPQTKRDSFAELHAFLEREIEMGVSIHRAAFSKEEIKLVRQKLKETRNQDMGIINAKQKLPGHKFMQDFSYSLDPKSLVPGEHVVHKSKGIGKFVRLQEEGSERAEYVILKYADGMAKLKSSQAGRLLYRYHQPGDKGKAPALSKLSDPRPWEKRKSKSKLAAQKMVFDLLQLYVSRLKQKRQPYAKDGKEMENFIENFPYSPTADQLQAFIDVENDMVNRETPMDRLICGDVGFGKTEVALRAIFRAFLAHKQVMVLAPTTILARQHYNVIYERFADYTARIALLCRFQTSAEKKKLAIEIKAGGLDIVVGTHALFNSKIHYNNLGLLVVDEEQKFGVKQKEHIASMRTAVDVLTLSATPIPRTLYLALTGFRDASLITTPPQQRLPIVTRMLEFDEERMIAAVNHELARDGQVYYVLPRSQGLESKKASLSSLFPGIEIGIAHGKQTAALLEETMDRFARGELRLLLCTNIIESGLDIRRVNTIIVEDIHLFGLAQIYQLRGRVGRAETEAHAYLFYPQKETLSDEALERLVAIEECCDLGQGFKLAERDLAIRGFGSVFGERQSGEAAHIGLDLFFDILFETMSKADSHIFFQYDFDEVKLDLDLEHSSDYIQDSKIYERVISQLEVAARVGTKELMYCMLNLRCEFGRETPSFELVLQAMYVRRLAADLGIHHIWTEGKTIFMEGDMSDTVFGILKEGVTSEAFQQSLTFKEGLIEIELLIELSRVRLIDRIFASMVDLRKALSHFARQ